MTDGSTRCVEAHACEAAAVTNGSGQFWDDEHIEEHAPKGNTPMTLTFLGQKYESTGSELAPMTTPNLTGKYRGNTIEFSGDRCTTATQQTLTYRGIRYTR